MIRSFTDSDTQKVWELRRPKGISAALAKAARRKMQILDAAESINDLRVPPGNRLEKLQPPREGQHSIRVNDQYRLCFTWRDGGAVRFLCPVPGYDRHFTILEDLGIEMINVPMRDDGPDMDLVEARVREDPSVQGIWCVPKYSNPGGQVYSDATVDRLGRLGTIAGPHFRIMCDNAYAVHDLYDDAPRLANVMDACRRHGTEDSLVLFGSTSKVTRAGAGISFIAASATNLGPFRKRRQVFTIGPDKVNQLRHVLFLRDLDGIRAHMRNQAAILRPRFELVLQHLSAAFDGAGMGSWTSPRGGYFVSFDALPGLATEIVGLAADAGVPERGLRGWARMVYGAQAGTDLLV